MGKLKDLAKYRNDFHVTLFMPPGQFGPITSLVREAAPWATFGMYGWEGTPFECRAWAEPEAKELVGRAIEMGYDKVFMPPGHSWDIELALGLISHKVTLVHKTSQNPMSPGLRVYPGPPQFRNMIEKHLHAYTHAHSIPIHPAFRDELIRFKISRFVTPIDMAVEVPGREHDQAS